MKTCTKCKIEKDLTEFNSRSDHKTKSVRSQCKTCMKGQRKAKYGLTSEAYQGMVDAQGNKCAICLCEESAKDGRFGELKALSVDHCHQTGKVRALLCDNCNRALGLLKDKPELLEKAASYLRKHQGV